MRGHFFPALLLTLCSAPVTAGVIPIPVLNNSFEDVDKDTPFPLEWKSDQKAKFDLATDAKDGKRSLHAHDDSESWPNAYQVIPGLPEDELVSVALWAKTKDVTKADEDWKIFRVYLKFIPLSGKETIVDLVRLNGTTNWKWYTKKKIKVPKGLRETQLVVGVDGVDGDAWIDRIILVKGTELPPETISASEEVGNRAEALKISIARSRAAVKNQALEIGPKDALAEARSKIASTNLIARQLEEDAAVSSPQAEDGSIAAKKAQVLRTAAAKVRERIAAAVRLIEEAEAAQEHEAPAKAEEISAAKATEALAALAEAETASQAAETAATASQVLMATWGGGFYRTSSVSKWEESNTETRRPYATFILVDANGVVYSGGEDKNLYDSSDNGKTWSATPTRLPAIPTGFAIDPDHPEHWVIATWGQGVWWSEDAGRNWIRGASPTAFLRRLSRISGALYSIGDDQTILKCDDFKGEWHSVVTLPRGIKGWDLAMKPGRTRSLIVATDAGIAEIGREGGVSFPKLEVSSAWARSLAVDESRVLIGTWGRGVIAWNPQASSTPYAVLINEGIKNMNVFALAVSVNPKPDVTGAGVLVEGPHVWTDRNGGIGGFTINGIVANPKDEKEMYCSSENGIYHSTNQGETWVKSGEMPAPKVGRLAIDPNNPNTLYAAAAFFNIASGIQKSTDGGKTWVQKLLGLKTMWVELDPGNPSAIFAATYGGGVQKSDDAAENWYEMSAGLASTNLYCVVVGSQEPRLIFGGLLGKGLQRFDTAKWAWIDSSHGITATDVWHVAQDPNEGNTWLAGTAGGGLFKSTDGGANWRAVTKGLTITGIYRVVYDRHKKGVVYVGGKAVTSGGSGGGVFRSADGGETWAPDNDGLANLKIEDLFITSTGLVYVATTSGIFYKQD